MNTPERGIRLILASILCVGGLTLHYDIFRKMQMWSQRLVGSWASIMTLRVFFCSSAAVLNFPQVSISQELGRSALLNRGQCMVTLPPIILKLLDAITFDPAFRINFSLISLHDRPLHPIADTATGAYWWTWLEHVPANPSPWWKHPLSPQVISFTSDVIHTDQIL